QPTPHLSTPQDLPDGCSHDTDGHGTEGYSRIPLAWAGSVAICTAGSAVIPSSERGADEAEFYGWRRTIWYPDLGAVIAVAIHLAATEGSENLFQLKTTSSTAHL
ncbi:hypothetical protein V502_06467, partial [Pseudogymnoascus sp. VKM F-4520 (FW-2644)]